MLGSILLGQLQSRVTDSLVAQGLSTSRAQMAAANVAQFHGGSGTAVAIPTFVRIDFAQATSIVLTAMSYVMVAAAVVAWCGLPRRRQTTVTNLNQAGEVPLGAQTDQHDPARYAR